MSSKRDTGGESRTTRLPPSSAVQASRDNARHAMTSVEKVHQGKVLPATRSIYFFIPTMDTGGAEGVMARLVNDLADQEYKVTLVTLEESDRAGFFPLDSRVARIGLGLFQRNRLLRLLTVPRTLWSLRKLVHSGQPKCLVSFLDVMNIPLLVATLGQNVPTIVSDRMDPRFHHFWWLRDRIRHLVYRHAWRIVVQTTQVRNRFPSKLQGKIEVIPNAVVPAQETARPQAPGSQGRFRIIAVGRLLPEKGFDRLIRAFALIAGRFPDWNVIIFGDGPERNRLHMLAARLGLKDKVILPGLTKCIDEELRKSHLLVLPSRHEGYPNALAEGAAHGLPAIAFAGVSGTDELIVDGQSGFLIHPGSNEAFELSNALGRLMEDHDLRARMGLVAQSNVYQNRPEVIHARWRALLDDCHMDV